jgi:hypothetical protein
VMYRFHYVPLSSSYSELHNIQTFFAGFPKELMPPEKEKSSSDLTSTSNVSTGALPRDLEDLDTNSTVKDVTLAPFTRQLTPFAIKVKSITRSDGSPFEADRAAKDIGENGRDWKLNIVRRTDMQVCSL